MIWHLYNNNEQYIMTDSPHEACPSSTLSVTDEDSSSSEENDSLVLKKSYVSPDSKSLFLNFAPDLHSKQSKSAKKPSKPVAVKVNGVNILNRKNLDSKTIADRIQKRKENHNILERRRRDCINNTILEIARVLPLSEEQKSNKHSILQSALNYIMSLQSENESIKQSLNSAKKIPPQHHHYPLIYEPRVHLNNDYNTHHIQNTL